MAQLNNDLDTIKLARDGMQTALAGKGQTVTKDIRTYAEAISNISGGGGSGDVKLFTTKAAMDSSSGNQEGDLAVVYGSSIQSVTEDTEFSSCTFPSTVVLSEAFSDNIYGSFRSTDPGSYFSGMVELSASYFRFEAYGDTMIEIHYSSSDGITYTRQDSEGETIDFETTIKWEDYEPWNNVYGNFMKIQNSDFQGLFEYQNTTGDIITLGLKLDDKLASTSVNTNIYGLKSDLQTKTIADSSIGYPIIAKYEYVKNDHGYTINTITKAYNAVSYHSNTHGLCIVNKNSKNYIAFYSEESTFDVYKYENGTNSKITLTKNPETGLSLNNITLIEEIDLSEWAIGYTGYYFDKSSSMYTIHYITSSSYTGYDISATTTPTYEHYVHVSSQLNLTSVSELLPNITALGKNGVVTGDGSIYNNLDATRVYEDIYGLNTLYSDSGSSSRKIFGTSVSENSLTTIKQGNSLIPIKFTNNHTDTETLVIRDKVMNLNDLVAKLPNDWKEQCVTGNYGDCSVDCFRYIPSKGLGVGVIHFSCTNDLSYHYVILKDDGTNFTWHHVTWPSKGNGSYDSFKVTMSDDYIAFLGPVDYHYNIKAFIVDISTFTETVVKDVAYSSSYSNTVYGSTLKLFDNYFYGGFRRYNNSDKKVYVYDFVYHIPSGTYTQLLNFNNGVTTDTWQDNRYIITKFANYHYLQVYINSGSSCKYYYYKLENGSVTTIRTSTISTNAYGYLYSDICTEDSNYIYDIANGYRVFKSPSNSQYTIMSYDSEKFTQPRFCGKIFIYENRNASDLSRKYTIAKISDTPNISVNGTAVTFDYTDLAILPDNKTIVCSGLEGFNTSNSVQNMFQETRINATEDDTDGMPIFYSNYYNEAVRLKVKNCILGTITNYDKFVLNTDTADYGRTCLIL